MSPFRNRRSLLTLATCLFPALLSASPLAAPGNHAEGLSRRSNQPHIPCSNAPQIIAGYPVTAADIAVPSIDNGPPTATTENYFPYLWCGIGTSTYVFMDPLGSYGYDKGSGAPIFLTGLAGAWNATQNAMKSNAGLGKNPPTGDGNIDGPHQTSLQWRIPVANLAPESGIQNVEIFAQDASGGKLTWGLYANALIIMEDFVKTYPLYADSMYFQISDSHWGTVGNGYMGLVFTSSAKCYLKGTTAQNNVVECSMPKDFPNN